MWYEQFSKIKIGLFALAFLLYANTLGHEYVLDDAIVITDNMYVQDGMKGIPGILTKDTFFGFFKVEGKAQLVSGGRYRPFTLIMFAIEDAIFGDRPMVGHLINIILYGLTGVLFYMIGLRLMSRKKSKSLKFGLPLIAAVIFIAHPLHTEVVANIKGRDEIMALLGALGAWYYLLKAEENASFKYILFAMLTFFIGLMSKENTITFLAVIPASMYFFTKAANASVIKKSAYLLIPTIVFLLIRFSILGTGVGEPPMELMNNPFVKLSGNAFVPFSMGEKMATILFTLGLYIKLLIFPYPLTHDYYPRHIDIMTFGDWQVILSLVVYIAIGIIALRGLKHKSLWAFSALYFLATLSIVSNIFFPIGTNMSERFMYMPSIGFALAAAYGIILLAEKLYPKGGLMNKISVGSLVGITLIFGAATVIRNPVWKTNDSLFLGDAETSIRSAKLQNAVGGTLISQASKINDGNQKNDYLNRAVSALNNAIAIHPNYKNAFLLRANAQNNLKNYEAAIADYGNALRIDPEYQEAQQNLLITYRQAGRYYGEEKGDLAQGQQYLLKGYQLNNRDYEVNRLLGITYGIAGNHPEAVRYFTNASQIEPNNAQSWVNLSKAYSYLGDALKENEYRTKALSIDPNAFNNN